VKTWGNRAERTVPDYRGCFQPWVKVQGKTLARGVVTLNLGRRKAELAGAGCALPFTG
jgi:hypothetical protein